MTATCNSDAHDTSWSRYAIDVARPQGTLIYASSSDNVGFAGWSDAEYGNLVRTQGGLKAYYAHMYNINWEIIYLQNWYVYRGDIIGTVGNTGNSSGNHLRLEVRDLNNLSVRLNGMVGFEPTTSTYAYPDSPCGSITYP